MALGMLEQQTLRSDKNDENISKAETVRTEPLTKIPQSRRQKRFEEEDQSLTPKTRLSAKGSDREGMRQKKSEEEEEDRRSGECVGQKWQQGGRRMSGSEWRAKRAEVGAARWSEMAAKESGERSALV